jgi:uncharacterized protein (TIGR02271 family)
MSGDEGVVRHEESLRVGAERVEAGQVHLRKRVETEHALERVGLGHEDADIERVAVDGEDSGEIETLADGSISVPLFAEELVIEKRLVVRERIIVRKRTELEDRVVEADLRREHVELDADAGVELRGEEAGELRKPERAQLDATERDGPDAEATR